MEVKGSKQSEKLEIATFNKKKKKSAIPEYIWYISLIIIAITLVFTVVSITNKVNKENVNKVPEIKDVSFSIIVTPLNEIKLVDLRALGIKKEDLVNFYLYCDGKYFRLGDEINISTYFSKDINNYVVLNKEIDLNLSKYNFSESCKKENAKWLLFYGEPGSNAAKLAETYVEYRSFN
jgi:hypothetical protein